MNFLFLNGLNMSILNVQTTYLAMCREYIDPSSNSKVSTLTENNKHDLVDIGEELSIINLPPSSSSYQPAKVRIHME